jgi:hypothetical protein
VHTFIMLTRLAAGAVPVPERLEELEQDVAERVRERCPKVEWLASYAVLGPCDYVDVFRAPDLDTALKTAALVRSFGHAQTEIWPATDWRHFKQLIRQLGTDEGQRRQSAESWVSLERLPSLRTMRSAFDFAILKQCVANR